MQRLAGYLRRLVWTAGFSVSRRDRLPPDLDPSSAATIAAVRPYTATPPERLYALCQAVRYVVANALPGEVVECGVWRGGSMMAAARTLIDVGDTTRRLRLFDTFEGMEAPGPHDRWLDGSPAAAVFAREVNSSPDGRWLAAGVAEVRAALSSTGYPSECISYVEGKVEDTLPAQAPEQIAVLRLDTDWYESTRHELACLYPRLVPGGVLIVDDYGFWQGARRAVDEYLAHQRPRPLLNRIDYSARIAVVPGALPGFNGN